MNTELTRVQGRARWVRRPSRSIRSDRRRRRRRRYCARGGGRHLCRRRPQCLSADAADPRGRCRRRPIIFGHGNSLSHCSWRRALCDGGGQQRRHCHGRSDPYRVRRERHHGWQALRCGGALAICHARPCTATEEATQLVYDAAEHGISKLSGVISSGGSKEQGSRGGGASGSPRLRWADQGARPEVEVTRAGPPYGRLHPRHQRSDHPTRGKLRN